MCEYCKADRNALCSESISLTTGGMDAFRVEKWQIDLQNYAKLRMLLVLLLKYYCCNMCGRCSWTTPISTDLFFVENIWKNKTKKDGVKNRKLTNNLFGAKYWCFFLVSICLSYWITGVIYLVMVYGIHNKIDFKCNADRSTGYVVWIDCRDVIYKLHRIIYT